MNIIFSVGMDDVTIGRCSQYDNQNLQVDANDSEVLWQEATSLLPNLKKAQIECETVSLRPHPFIRIEREEIELIDGSNLSIIHHYVRAHHIIFHEFCDYESTKKKSQNFIFLTFL